VARRLVVRAPHAPRASAVALSSRNSLRLIESSCEDP
jgi:hypothetical protein